MDLPPPDLPVPSVTRAASEMPVPVPPVVLEPSASQENLVQDENGDVFEAAQSFGGLVREAFGYPLRPGYWQRFGIGALVALVILVGLFVPGGGWLAGLGGGCYAAAYYFAIVYHTVNGKSGIPPLPDIFRFREDVVIPGMQMLVVALLSCVPLGAAVWFSPVSSSVHGPLVLAGYLYMWLYFPMATLAVVCHGNCEGSEWTALPQRVIPAVLRCLPGYLVCAGAFALAQAVYVMSDAIVGRVPILPWLCLLYLLMVQARLSGLIYLRYREKIGWG